MRLYEVGGAVRDSLLGLSATDRDWVAVGATPEQMLALGYKPVGRDFPVFLHPETGEEVALARTERKSGRGYHGFTFHADASVTLEEDLRRRDLTINAMARDEHGTLIDPHGGQRDLAARVLRHVSEAFAEDPVRLLRVARLAARFREFSVAPETMALLRRMVAAGEVDALVSERVWQELSRGLMEARPGRMLRLLNDCGALPHLLPELALGEGDLAQRCARLDRAADEHQPLPVRYALCCWAAPEAATIAERWRVPRECAELAALLQREAAALADAHTQDAAALVQLFQRADAWRRPERWALLLRAATLVRDECAAPLQLDRLRSALFAAQAVDAGAAAAAAAKAGARGEAIATAVHQARVAAVAVRLRAAAPGLASPSLCEHPPHAAG